MTRSSTHQTIVRHWQLLSKLPISQPGITATQLREHLYDEGYDISKRQIERDLLDLEGFFVLGCNDKGKPYGWFWPEDSRKRFFFASLSGNGRLLLNQHHDALRHALHPHDFSLLISQLGNNFVGRRWLFKSVADWRHESQSPILWISGIAGVGKSAFAARLIKREGLNVVGHYFCRFHQDQDPNAVARDFIQTLAHQLSEKYPAYRDNLVGRLSANPNIVRPDAPLQALFEQLVSQPLSQIRPVEEQANVIVDALDEAMGNNGFHPLADLLVGATGILPSWLRIIVTSRPELSIQQRFGQFETQAITYDHQGNIDDLRTYLETTFMLSIVGNRRSALIEEIIEKSAGSFLYVTAVTRANSVEILKRKVFPTNMDGFFRANFQRFFPNIEKYTALQAPLLSLIVAFPKPLPDSLASSILGITEHEWVSRLQPMLGSLVVKDEEGYQLFHRCLLDWITDLDRSWPYTVPTDGKNRIADFLVSQLISPDWYDYSPEQRNMVLSYLPDLIKYTQHWNALELLTTLAQRLHKAYSYQVERPVIRRIRDLVERQAYDPAQTIRALCLSAANSRCLGDFEGAFSDLEHAKDIADEQLPKPDGSRILVFRQFGLTAHKTGDFSAAGEWFIRAIEEFKALDRQESELAELLNNAGRMLMHVPARIGEAEDFIRQSLQIRTRLFGEKHPVCGATLNNLGYLYMLDSRLKEAEQVFQQALLVKRMRNTGYDESVALAEANLGSVYLQLGQAAQAEIHLRLALDNRRALYGEHSIPVARTLEKLGKAHLALHRDDEALEDIRRASECFKANFGSDNLTTLESMMRLAEAQMKTGQNELAKATAQEILPIVSLLGTKGNVLRQEVETFLSSTEQY